MKNHILLLLLIVNVLFLNGQSESESESQSESQSQSQSESQSESESENQSESESDQGSYILTTEGEKIKIVPNTRIFFNRFTINYSKSSKVYGKKKKVEGIGYISKHYDKEGSIKAEKIVKIVDGERLYLPFIDHNGRPNVFRYIAKNDKYILGTYSYEYFSGGNFVKNYYYVFLDHDYHIVKQGRLLKGKSNKRVEKESEQGITEIKNEFGECLNRDDDDELLDLYVKNGIEPDDSFSIDNLLNNRKYIGYVGSEFLGNDNQIQCD